MQPKNLNECFTELINLLTQEDLKMFSSYHEKQIDSLHSTLGRQLRNDWELWNQESILHKWFLEKGIHHPDDMSFIILISFHRHLNKKSIELEKQIKRFKAYWDKMKEHA
jgi:hypothetical protein